MKGIGVFHDEFAATHQPEARPDFIAKLALDLIQAHRQLPVGAQQICSQGGDDLFMGGAKAELSFLSVLQVEHDPFACGIAGPATTPLPELSRLQLRQQGLEGTGGIHLLTDDGRHLAQNPPHQGQIGVDAGRDATDVASSQ